MLKPPHIDFLELPCERLPAGFDGLALLHLSDLHITRWNRSLDRWQRALAKLPSADLLVITGDLGHRSWLWKKSFASVQRLLEPLAPRLGTYFILGNHDSIKLGPALAETRDAGGRLRVLLRNETVFFEETPKGVSLAEGPEPADGNPQSKIENPKSGISNFKSQNSNLKTQTPRLALIGIHQHRRIDTDIPAAMRPVTPQDFKLMLLHYPDLIHPAIAAGADVCLAGHTHGGQICWPDGRPLFRQDTLPSTMCTGVHKINGTWMVVNRGIGSAGLKMRLFCPPQAVMMTLRAGAHRAI